MGHNYNHLNVFMQLHKVSHTQAEAVEVEKK